MTSVESNPPLKEIVDANLLPWMMGLCDREDADDTVRLNILWVITNVLSGNQEMSHYVVDNGGVDLLLKYCGKTSGLSSPFLLP